MLLAAVLLCLSFSASADIISSQDLINNAAQYDSQTVEYAGEAIGDVMIRGQYAWVNVNDGNTALGIWLSKELARQIKITGSYHFIGDKVKVTGTFHRTCVQHGGDLDIHATSLEVIDPGFRRTLTINYQKLLISVILLLGTLAIIFLPRFSSTKP
ncbi:hypothetical protein A2548_04890 [candidate division WOR-1 bacterium RIFOXYD2_FULL_41_8]|nr:MAG: hypothetical protein A2548_04890 [candidate division WOR-1 bacterium RIFOXYD2_FULL_41_8]